jgi:DNA-binding Xre family transcriptional regulator
MIKINKALQKTMQDFGIKGVWLAEKTGISNQTISTYLVGKGEMKTDTLERLIDGLSFEARDYFFKLLHPRTTDIEAFLQDATQEEKAEVLRLVAASLEKTPNPTKTALAGSREVMPV